MPREVHWNDRIVMTGYIKKRAEGPVFLRLLNLDGDGQRDLVNHGGTEKAAYAYPSEHYESWRAELPDANLEWGAFGENFTVEGLFENEINIRDRFRIGKVAEVRVTQPRIPCPKLGMRFGDPGMVQKFQDRPWPGFYLGVACEGPVEAGDTIERTFRDPTGITVVDMHRMIHSEKIDVSMAEYALRAADLPDEWQDFLRNRIAQAR
jgi:MOSC domain-containing protein YiiM